MHHHSVSFQRILAKYFSILESFTHFQSWLASLASLFPSACLFQRFQKTEKNHECPEFQNKNMLLHLILISISNLGPAYSVSDERSAISLPLHPPGPPSITQPSDATDTAFSSCLKTPPTLRNSPQLSATLPPSISFRYITTSTL